MECGSDGARRIAQLRAQVHRYRARYGELDGMVDLEQADRALGVRERRLEQLTTEYQRIGLRMRSLNAEVERIERWIQFCLEDVVARARQAHAEGWSPTAVLGYRLWAIGEDGMHGVKMAWRGRTMTATCLARGGSEEIPHTDGRCGRLGCGVYAAKSVDSLFRGFDVSGIGDVALGLVALTGKVVEHETGYRAAAATVVALGASHGEHLLLTDDADRIDTVFARPTLITGEPVVETHQERLLEMETYVEQAARRMSRWTLASNSE